MKRTPLKRSPAPARRTAVKRKRSKPRRVSVLRDRGYLDWLRDRECVLHRNTGQPVFLAVDPAHGPVNGRSSKGPDNEAIPLCRYHHEEQHRIGWSAFELKYGIDREKEARTHYAAYLIVSGKLPPAEGLIK